MKVEAHGENRFGFCLTFILVEERIMSEQVKAFTFVSGHGETMVEPKHEDHINQWRCHPLRVAW